MSSPAAASSTREQGLRLQSVFRAATEIDLPLIIIFFCFRRGYTRSPELGVVTLSCTLESRSDSKQRHFFRIDTFIRQRKRVGAGPRSRAAARRASVSLRSRLALAPVLPLIVLGRRERLREHDVTQGDGDELGALRQRMWGALTQQGVPSRPLCGSRGLLDGHSEPPASPTACWSPCQPLQLAACTRCYLPFRLLLVYAAKAPTTLHGTKKQRKTGRFPAKVAARCCPCLR